MIPTYSCPPYSKTLINGKFSSISFNNILYQFCFIPRYLVQYRKPLDTCDTNKYTMQLIPIYVNRSRTIAVVNTAGFVTEYRPVYTHEIRITKGIDNLIEFRFLNADQKPVDVSGQTVKFVAYDDEQIKVLDLTGTLTAITGLVTVSIPQEDINDIPSQYLRYALYLDNGSTQTLTYADSHFGNSGTIYLDGSVFPVPRGDIDLPFTASAQILVTDDSS